MLTKTLSEAKKKQRNILIKAMNNDIGSIDSAKDSWNPAQISERAKDISYIRSLVDTWNPAQLNEALKMLDLPVIDTWNPAQIEEQRRNLVFCLVERTLTGNPITLNILGNLTPEVTELKVTMNPIQSGSGEPSTTNIRPITGRTEASVTRTGKNLFDKSTSVDGYRLDSTGQPFPDVSFSISDYIRAFPNTNYVKNEPISINIPFCFYDMEKNFIVRYTSGNYVVSPSNAYYMRLAFIPTNKDTLQVEIGSTATAYEPYQGETHTHTYSDTIYGGVDDFVNGGLTNEWGYIASYDGETLPGEWISDRDVYAPDTTPTAGAEVAYRLETPTTIETSAEEITLLKGENVLSTDGDSIELKYKQNF